MKTLKLIFSVALSLITGPYWQWKAKRAYSRYAAGASRAPHSECIDCGTETKPGPGAARCTECWQDRCGHYFVSGEEGMDK